MKSMRPLIAHVTNSGTLPTSQDAVAFPFREIKVFIDGTLAGTAWPFPIMYAGALNPSLWRPVPGIEALNISPYTVNLTPLVGLLTNRSPNSIGFQIANFMSSWRLDADLLLYLDPSVAITSGALLSETLPTDATTAQTTVVDSAQVNQTTTATRVISLLGYVNSSSGHALADVSQVMTFKNQQILDLIGFTGHVLQAETIATIISVSGPGGVLVQMTNETYSLNFSYDTYLSGDSRWGRGLRPISPRDYADRRDYHASRQLL